jgi:hypothetical protein
MAASGNYKRHDLPEESAFIPTARRPSQGEAEMMTEFQKLARM